MACILTKQMAIYTSSYAKGHARVLGVSGYTSVHNYDKSLSYIVSVINN